MIDTAIDTKKKLEQDFTQQPQATTQADVDAQDSRTRLWQSLNYSYGDQIRNSDKSYDQAYSQADRQALSRGMQRSSYNNQTLANLSNQKIEAQNDIRAAQIADYQNRINDIEAQERQEAFQREQFEYQKAQDALAQQNWQTQMDYQQSRDAVSDAFNEKQWQAQQDQWQAQQEQWKQEFEYSKMSSDQKLAYESIMTIIGQGNDPSDDLLKRAGLSRADVNAMKAQTPISGSSYNSKPAWQKAGFTSEDEYNKAKANGYSTKAEYDAGMYNAVYGNGTGNRYADQIATIVGYGVGSYDKSQGTANSLFNSVFKKKG